MTSGTSTAPPQALALRCMYVYGINGTGSVL